MSENLNQTITRTTLSVKETAVFLGVSPKTIYKMAREKQIPFVKIGRRVLFKIDSLERWLAKQEEGSNEVIL